jgi:chromatin remodeling complex protein RSC6
VDNALRTPFVRPDFQRLGIGHCRQDSARACLLAAQMPKKSPMASKLVQPNEILATIVGTEPVARNQVTEMVLEYAAANGLIDPQTKTKINADEKLRLLFDGKESISMFELNKFIVPNIRDCP